MPHENTSTLGSRFGLAQLLGVMFGGKRKLYEVFGYQNIVQYQHVLAKYSRQDIAGRIISAYADALWGNPPEMISKNEDWNKAWKKLEVDLSIYQSIARVDKLAAMGKYSTLLIGFNAGSDLALPVQAGQGKEVLFFQPFSIDTAVVNKLVDDKTSAKFNLPEMYSIKPGQRKSQTGTVKIEDFKVHETRMLHVLEGVLEDMVFGYPKLEKVFNLLDDLLKTVGGTSETFWLTANRGLQIDIDKDMELTPDDEEALSDEIEEYQHQLRRTLRTRGVKVTSLGSDIPKPKEIFSVLMALISGATGIPQRILIGSEAGQLASEQDRNNWADRIEERRSEFGEPVILRPLVKKLTFAGALPEAEFDIRWPSAFKLSPLEDGQTSAQLARSATNFTKSLESEVELITRDEARDMMGLEPAEEAAAEPTEDAETEEEVVETEV